MKATFELLWLIPFLPLLGALLNGALSLGGARSAIGPNRGFVSLIAVLMPGLSFVLTVIATIKLSSMQTPGVNNVLAQDLWSWFAIDAGGFMGVPRRIAHRNPDAGCSARGSLAPLQDGPDGHPDHDEQHDRHPIATESPHPAMACHAAPVHHIAVLRERRTAGERRCRTGRCRNK